MAVLLMYNDQDSYTVEQIHEHTQIKMVRSENVHSNSKLFGISFGVSILLLTFFC